ncbi:MAG TPA: hypothetical protein ENL00_03295 [Nitratifractor sp.]|nr:hypothetical protein [Nitratifractor sp.]HHD74829.1 hypothetical protein [Nitratifractor sp.]
MRIRVILLLLIVGFFMNGCLADRIKQRMYYLQMKDKIAKQKNRNRLKTRREFTAGSKVKHDATYKKEKKLYQPSQRETIKPIPDVEEISLGSHKSRKVVKKKKKKNVRKAKVSRKSKKSKKPVKKTYEPYSIEDEKKDPELLGPQTTLESNPLLEDKDKI